MRCSFFAAAGQCCNHDFRVKVFHHRGYRVGVRAEVGRHIWWLIWIHLKDFENGFSGGHAGFSVAASGCNGCLTITWKEVANNPTSFMFFGAPSSARCYNVVFKDVTNTNKFHHRFLQFYDEFEGDSVACLALHNSYVMAQLAAVGKASRQKVNNILLTVPGNLLVTEKVKNFCKDFDFLFEAEIRSVFSECKRHFEPIVSTQKNT